METPLVCACLHLTHLLCCAYIFTGRKLKPAEEHIFHFKEGKGTIEKREQNEMGNKKEKKEKNR